MKNIYGEQLRIYVIMTEKLKHIYITLSFFGNFLMDPPEELITHGPVSLLYTV